MIKSVKDVKKGDCCKFWVYGSIYPCLEGISITALDDSSIDEYDPENTIIIYSQDEDKKVRRFRFWKNSLICVFAQTTFVNLY